MIRFATDIHIDRPRTEVYGVVSDPTTYPRWNSAVRRVQPEGPPLARRYRMDRELPSGHAVNRLAILDADEPERLVIQATDGPTPFTYAYRLQEQEGGTHLSCDAEVEVEGIAGFLGPLAALAIKRGVDSNLTTLKTLLEQGRMSPT
jgi:uncharacterized protein YndB with AHSA1/START domain